MTADETERPDGAFEGSRYFRRDPRRPQSLRQTQADSLSGIAAADQASTLVRVEVRGQAFARWTSVKKATDVMYKRAWLVQPDRWRRGLTATSWRRSVRSPQGPPRAYKWSRPTPTIVT